MAPQWTSPPNRHQILAKRQNVITLTHHCRHHMQNISKHCKTGGLVWTCLDLLIRVLHGAAKTRSVGGKSLRQTGHWKFCASAASHMAERRHARDSWHQRYPGIPNLDKEEPIGTGHAHGSSCLQKLHEIAIWAAAIPFRHPTVEASAIGICGSSAWKLLSPASLLPEASKALVSLDTACHYASIIQAHQFDPLWGNMTQTYPVIQTSPPFRIRIRIFRIDVDVRLRCLQGLFPVLNGKATSNLQNGL